MNYNLTVSQIVRGHGRRHIPYTILSYSKADWRVSSTGIEYPLVLYFRLVSR